MIHIATVHWKTEKWIDLQLQYLRKNIRSNFKIYSFVPENFDNINHPEYKFISKVHIIKHEDKLNILADIMCLQADLEDIIIFIDSDAFPIHQMDEYLKDKLRKYPLIAIRRDENMGEKHPHPAFLATTAENWKRMNVNWNKDYSYLDSLNNLYTDVGANILEYFVENNIDWYPLLRTNKTNYHPLLFGIYDNMIYHHGAGSRKVVTKYSMQKKFGKNAWKKWKPSFFEKAYMNLKEFTKRFSTISKLEKDLGDKRISDELFNRINQNPDEYFNELSH